MIILYNQIKWIKNKFGVSFSLFFKVLKQNKSADGYILGGIGEELFYKYAQKNKFDIYRIKEKPAGGNSAKSDEARGDFYIKPKEISNDEWYVVECKSLKSNSEDRTVTGKDQDPETRRKKIIQFLESYSTNREMTVLTHLRGYLKKYYSKKRKFVATIKYPKYTLNRNSPGAGIPDLSKLWKTKKEIEEWYDQFDEEEFSDEYFRKGEAPIKLLQTHMPSSRKDPATGIESTGPLRNEFSILCLDLFIKTGEHQLIFANSETLTTQSGSPNHLQQNYNIDILVKKKKKDKYTSLKIEYPWFTNLRECIDKTSPRPRKLDLSQIDTR